MMESYDKFLRAKVKMADDAGFVVHEHEINPILKPHQKAIVMWACLGGRRAIFAAFGLGKSVIQRPSSAVTRSGIGCNALLELMRLNQRGFHAN